MFTGKTQRLQRKRQNLFQAALGAGASIDTRGSGHLQALKHGDVGKGIMLDSDTQGIASGLAFQLKFSNSHMFALSIPAGSDRSGSCQQV